MKLFRRRVIGYPENPLLIRYVLFRCAAWGIYVHHLLRSDHDRALHDHPWPFISIVLRGGYAVIHDQTEDGTMRYTWRSKHSIALRAAEWRHRVLLSSGATAWTLVIVGRRGRRWGFFTPRGWCW